MTSRKVRLRFATIMLEQGMEISGVRWKDVDLLGYAHSYEQATHNRRLPKLVERQKEE
jgi:Asp-tRNA(Asn)/Glu-tRNA(Gln) amidotransferase A subunit family amidase